MFDRSHPMELSDLLAEESVFFLKGVSSKDEMLDLVASRAGQQLGQTGEAIRETLANREALGSTGLGDGIAIPHGKLPGLGRVSGFFMRLATPIEFDAVDDLPVDLVMVLLAPLGAGAEHLKALSRVARALRDDAIVSQLRASQEPRQLYAVLTSASGAHKAA